jgi:membrane associated rhomboid family serine protease
MRARIAYVFLGLTSAAMTVVVMSLWLTEPALPSRTRIAFAVLSVIGLGWLMFSIWVLRSKHVLLSKQRVVAGRLAVCFTGLFLVGSVILGMTASLQAAWSAAIMGVAFFVVATVLWRRAVHAHAALLARRVTLERELDRRGR